MKFVKLCIFFLYLVKLNLVGGKMKATGIVRRIDELGRIVIPKELRRTFRIKEGTPLEIFIGEQGELILKKFSPIIELNDIAKEIAESIYQTLNCGVLIFDSDKYLVGYGSNAKPYIDKEISFQLEKVVMQRQSVIKNSVDLIKLSDFDNETHSQLISPIVLNGDVVGGILLISKTIEFTQNDIKIVKTMVNFIEKQIS